MKLSKREIILLYVLGIALLFLVAFFAAIKPFMDQTAEAEAKKQSVQDKMQIAEMQVLARVNLESKLLEEKLKIDVAKSAYIAKDKYENEELLSYIYGGVKACGNNAFNTVAGDIRPSSLQPIMFGDKKSEYVFRVDVDMDITKYVSVTAPAVLDVAAERKGVLSFAADFSKYIKSSEFPRIATNVSTSPIIADDHIHKGKYPVSASMRFSIYVLVIPDFSA